MSFANHDKPFVRIERINKSWNGEGGVSDINLTIPEGAFVAFLGPSGCGKSTTLRLISGLEQPDSGDIFIRDQNVTASTPAQRGLSMVFQSYALFPHLSVAENIVFGLKVRGMKKAARQQELKRALKLTNLEGLEDRKPGAISGGQRQRVALARAIVAGHPLCLMDEPLSNLDAKLRHAVRKDIKRIQQKLGMTILYVTHDQTEAMSMADIVVLLKDGAIEQVGTPSQLYNEPNSQFVASFIGSPPMGFFDADLVPELDQQRDHKACQYGIRPESIRISESQGRFKMTIDESEFLGAETFLYLTHPKTRNLTARLAGEQIFEAGKTVYIDFDAADVQAFCKQTGKKLSQSTDH